jgi:hypothetical protein
MPKQANEGPKKPYSPPQVTIYGTVQELTKKVGNTGSTDHGTIFHQTKTHA